MKMNLPAGRYRVALSVLGLCIVLGIVFNFSEQGTIAGPEGESGTLQKMIVSTGTATMNLELNRLNVRSASSSSTLRFSVEPDAFFKILVFNDELRGVLPSVMDLKPDATGDAPAKLRASLDRLVIESMPPGSPYEMVVRDGSTGFVFFNIQGQESEFVPGEDRLNLDNGALVLSDEFAAELGRSVRAGTVVGNISISAIMRSIEVTRVVNGEVTSESLPALNSPDNGTVPGPDVIVGDLSGLAQFGTASGTQVGLAVGTDSCNAGTIPLNWFANPNNDHPVIPQNLYKMSGGAANDERFEQIGQSSVKHAFTALQQNLCGFGCASGSGSQLGSGCSDPYGAGLNAGPNLGSRAWINPFTGAFPRNDSATPNNNHTGHTHLGPSHRILTEVSNLNTSLNPGATYYAEAQYVTPHEYAWCQANPTQCNMYNNVSYRRYNVSGTTCAPGSSSCYSFSPAAATVRTQRAVAAWPGATLVEVKPAPGIDGVAVVAYKVTNPSPGIWHYEYAIFNENLDRAIQSFTIPTGPGVTFSNLGFHAPPQHPGWSQDGTIGNAGFSSTPWTANVAQTSLSWSTETFAQNPNANAIRWGTLYNFRFDSNRPPVSMVGSIGFLKTGQPIAVVVQGPSPDVNPSCGRLSLFGERCT